MKHFEKECQKVEKKNQDWSSKKSKNWNEDLKKYSEKQNDEYWKCKLEKVWKTWKIIQKMEKSKNKKVRKKKNRSVKATFLKKGTVEQRWIYRKKLKN